MNYSERAELVALVEIGEDELGRPITEEQTTPAQAMVNLVSSREVADGAFSVTDVSVRVPSGYAVLPADGSVRIVTGPLAGTYSIFQVRPNRHHTRYVCRRVV